MDSSVDKNELPPMVWPSGILGNIGGCTRGLPAGNDGNIGMAIIVLLSKLLTTLDG